MSIKNAAVQQQHQLRFKTKMLVQGKNALVPVLLGGIVPLLLIIIWEILCRLELVPVYLLPAPTDILRSIINMVKEGTLWGHIGVTLYRLFSGFLIGVLFASVIGSLVGYLKKVEQLFDPLIQAFRSIPSLAWVPLFILWLGIGESSKVVLIAVGVFFPVYLNIVSGIQSVDRKLIEVGKVYNFSSFQLIRKIILPAAMPSFLVGLRSGLGLGWMFVVAAEIMGASKGIGYLLIFGQNTYSPELIISSIILFAVLGKSTDAILKAIEKRTLHWQDTIVKKE